MLVSCSILHLHLRTCDHLLFILHLRTCDHLLFIRNLCYDKEYFTQVVRDNTTVLDCDNYWNLLLYKEAYYIKRLAPSLNNGLKSSRDTYCFRLLTQSI